MLKPTSRQERTGWRDQSLSARHRLYGFDCPATDIDFLMLEFHRGKPAALVEYKALGASLANVHRNTLSALRTLADASDIPFFVVFYHPKTWVYTVQPHNRRALDFVPRVQHMSERAYVALLYQIRGMRAPDTPLATLRGLP